MRRKVLALVRTFVFLLPLSLCIVSCEEFNLENIFGDIIEPGGEGESEEYDEDLILRELAEMEVGFICDSNYVEGAESYLFTNGLAMSVSSDSMSGYFVLIDSLDLAEAAWTESKRISVHLDSLYRPILAISVDSKMLFNYESDETFSVIAYAADGTSREVEIPYRHQSATRASAQPSGLDGVCNGLDILGVAQDGLGSNGFGHVNAIANLLTKALPEGLPQDFASLTLTGAPMIPAVAEFLATRFGYVATGPLGWIALIASSAKTLQDLCAWLVEQKIGDCTPLITSVDVKGRNSVDIRVEFRGDGFFGDQSDTPMFCIQYWRERDGERYGMTCTSPQQARYGFQIETISDLVGGEYSFQVVLYPSSYSSQSNVLNFKSNIMHAEICPLYLSEVVQEESLYNDGLLTFSIKALTAFQSDQDRVILSFYPEYGVYSQIGNGTREEYSYESNGSNEYYINLDFRKENLHIDTQSFKAVPKQNVKFGVYTIDRFGLKDCYDEQILELVYTEHPEAHTGESSSVSKTEATVKCEYEDCLFWNVLRGVEYSSDTKTESILLDATKEDGEYDFHLDGLTPNTTYKYRAYYEVNGVREYGETKSFKTKGSDLCSDANHVHAVDLGLSVKWACCNVGASVPEGYGGYYAWGETEEKSNYDWDNYKHWSDRDGDGFAEKSEITNIGSNISGTSYDVAHVKWGGSWRMPTWDEIKELCNKCSWEWTTVNGVSGLKVTGPNGNSIFLPAAGYRVGTDVDHRGSSGVYWSATLYDDYSYDAYNLYFGSGGRFWCGYSYFRGYGRTVRPVTE